MYATGSLVLWTRRGSGVDVDAGWQALATDRVRRISIANPEHAPYGRAAVAALRRAGFYERLQPKLVLGENVGQAAQFVQSGNADAGLLPLALARSEALARVGEYVVIPATLYPPIEQAAVVLRGSTNKEAARAFLAYLQRADVAAMLAEAGFGPAPVRSRK